MDLDAAQSVVRGFASLRDPQSRRAAHQGIWSLLNSWEIRNFMSYAENWMLQYDILGRLPLELVGCVAQHLNPADFFILRRVSKRWNDILSHRYVLSSFITTVICPLHEGIPVPDLESIMRSRWRLETGNPVAERKFPISAPFKFYESIYCSGWFALFPDEYTERNQEVTCVELRTGAVKSFTTENRLDLKDIQLTTSLVSVVATNGYCYVWNYRDETSRSFRLPSTNYSDHYANACNVVFEYESTGSLVFFCFTSGRARTIDVGAKILALNPSMSSQTHCSKFTILTLERKDGQKIIPDRIKPQEWKEYQLQVRINQGESTMAECPVSQTQDLLPLFSTPLREDLEASVPCTIKASACQVFPGQRSSYLHFIPSTAIHFSLGRGTGITIHLITCETNSRLPIHIYQGVMYLPRVRIPNRLRVFIASGSMISDMPPGVIAYDLRDHSTKLVTKGNDWLFDHVRGDSRFIVMKGDRAVKTWEF